MDDLVKRLNMVDATMHPMTLVIVAREAADRIEQLEASLRQLSETDLTDVAVAALGKKR